MFRFSPVIPVILIFFALLIANNAHADFAESLSKSKTYQEQGQYRIALDEAQKALKLAETNVEKARAEGAVGNLLLIMKDYVDAEKALLSAIELSSDRPTEKAGYLNNLGNLYSAQDKTSQADNYYGQALRLAGGNPALQLEIKLNRLYNKPATANTAELNSLLQEIAKLASTQERVRSAVTFAAIAQAANDPESRELAIQALEQARIDSAGIKDSRLRIEVLSSLADKYEKQNQEDKALQLSEEATSLQTTENIQDLLAELEWRKARIYQKQGKDELSLAAYGKAVDNIQDIRMDIPVEYHDGRSSFRETLGPIYLGYAYQLLKKAGHQNGDSKQTTLLLARQTVEQIKQTEMEDFLGGRCLIEGLRRSELDNIDASAATIYPIILPDRMELLVGIGKTIHQYTVPVTDQQVRASATAFAQKLRNLEDDYSQYSQQLYAWLISPIEKDLEMAKIKTLVIVPDGVLRLVPFSALNDGQHYLVEKYALSVSPGMSLMNGGGNAGHHSYQTLLSGLSRPGSVVEKLPAQLVIAILDSGQEQGSSQRALPATRSLGKAQLRSVENAPTLARDTRDAENLIRKPGALQKLKEELSLPGVENELNRIKPLVKNTTLLNEGFTVDSFHQAAASQSYEVIHIASHGVFTSDADTSFIMAYDNVLKINDLESLLKGEKPDKTLELLTLSACETAEGDDRAPLGFTSVALKAHARSAIGSLWPISDAAASFLMGSFYQHLNENQNKAEALRQSQLELMKHKDMSHPFFWSPFILVGNWI